MYFFSVQKYSPQVLHGQAYQLYFAFHVFLALVQNVFLSKTPSWFYPCRFPFLTHPFDHLKHQPITTRSCGLCLPAVQSLLSAFQWELLPAEQLPVCQTQEFVGKVSRFYMEDCLNVVQLVGSHTGRCTSDSLFVQLCRAKLSPALPPALHLTPCSRALCSVPLYVNHKEINVD